MRLTIILTSLLCVASMACQQDASERRATSQPATPSTTHPAASNAPAPPTKTMSSDSVSHEGVLEMARTHSGKRFQPTTLLREDASTLLLSYRPMPDHYHLVGERVRVTGKTPSFEGHEQRVSGEHFTPEKIEPLEEKTRQARDTMPPTPHLKSVAQAPALHARWVHAHGTFGQAEGISGDGSWVMVRFVLEGDEPLALSMASSTYEREWKPLAGKPVTIEGKLVVSQDEGALGTTMMGVPILLCEGHEQGCPASYTHPK